MIRLSKPQILLLHEQLIRLIGNVYSYDIVPAFVVTQKSLNEYDLIISTVQMENVETKSNFRERQKIYMLFILFRDGAY